MELLFIIREDITAILFFTTILWLAVIGFCLIEANIKMIKNQFKIDRKFLNDYKELNKELER